MNKPTNQQVNKLKELYNGVLGTSDKSTQKGLLTHFSQILHDISPVSDFYRDFRTQLISFDVGLESSAKLTAIMRNAIDYYQAQV